MVYLCILRLDELDDVFHSPRETHFLPEKGVLRKTLREKRRFSANLMNFHHRW